MAEVSPLVSVIIPCRKADSDVERCVKALNKLEQNIEILVITDSICPGLPAWKRNYAMQQAQGDIYAFIDSDAYPSKDWLKNALYWLKTFDAVCGPGVLPPDADYKERIADSVHQRMFCSYRVVPQSPRMVSWFPTFNLIVKKHVATKFADFLTGEDDKFGLQIKGGIFYHPDILVYHNRRGAFRPLWKQFGTWARHKGAFQGVAFVAFVTTLFTYAVNFVKGFIRRKP